jgi:c-di-AMP phosphodiesterase-like protein
MPRNLSAWIDICIHLAIIFILVLVLSYYNFYVAAIGFLVLVCMVSFARERCMDRRHAFRDYCNNVIRNVNDVVNYAIEKLPQAVLLVDENGRLQWSNKELERYLGKKPAMGTSIKDYWPGIILGPVWGTQGEYIFANEAKYYRVQYRPVATAENPEGLMALYVSDVTADEKLRREHALSRTVLAYIQIDNYDEVLQGTSEAERTALLFEVNHLLDDWMRSIGGFMRRVNEDLYLAVLERAGLDKAMADRFEILDRVRMLHGTNRLPVTLSLGVAVADDQSMDELGTQAQAGLDLSLGRGGDQVAVEIDGKTRFYGGKAKAVEKHTRVKARVVAHAVRDIMESSDEVFIMGHHNEDFDCLGAAMGVAKMARQLKKPVHIILSDMNDGIDKLTDKLREKTGYEELFIREDALASITSVNPVLFVVDTHIPHLVAVPGLLQRISQVIVIDHHRRSEDFIKGSLLIYIEPASSSTSELVTELLMYFSDDLSLGRTDATALYAGIVVDTKNFAVQTGVRTFDAAAYLRRSGADPVVVRHLFRTDYETDRALSRAKAGSQFFPGGLIVASFPESMPNIQAIAAQTADSMLRIDQVRMSVVVFQLTPETVGVSSRSTGELNVQVIMEEFGGGGHQNVAGAQIKGETLEQVMQRVIASSRNYIEENDKDESDFESGHKEAR